MKPTEMPPLHVLAECFKCNVEDGILVWKERPLSHFVSKSAQQIFNKRFAGTEAGNKQKRGYVAIQLFGTNYKLHRLIYFMATGNQPGQIDHVNCNKQDNRIENLRPATPTQNCMNHGLRKDSKSGIKGVCWHKNLSKWQAQCRKGGKTYHAGYFESKEEAERAVVALRGKLHGNFANHGD